jgi:hypothetical protein
MSIFDIFQAPALVGAQGVSLADAQMLYDWVKTKTDREPLVAEVIRCSVERDRLIEADMECSSEFWEVSDALNFAARKLAEYQP